MRDIPPLFAELPRFPGKRLLLSCREVLISNDHYRYGLEAAIWAIGLLAVGLADPTLPSALDLCLFKAVGLPGCPGCGLGHAMGYLFRGEWALALESHWFSPVVLTILITRIGSLLRQAFRSSQF